MKLKSKIATIILLIGLAAVSSFFVNNNTKTLINRIEQLESSIASLENENTRFNEKVNKKIEEVKEDFNSALENESDHLERLIDIESDYLQRLIDIVDKRVDWIESDVSRLQSEMCDVKR